MMLLQHQNGEAVWQRDFHRVWQFNLQYFVIHRRLVEPLYFGRKLLSVTARALRLWLLRKQSRGKQADREMEQENFLRHDFLLTAFRRRWARNCQRRA